MFRLLILISALLCGLFHLGMAMSGTLSDTPLSLKATVPPNVLFALSVEYPTANTAAYQGVNDYKPTSEYLGLFDPDKCYDYDTSNSWFYAPSDTLAAAHVCASTYWSGNFLNWASMTGLDEFRFAMTGGNRYRDTESLTVLERTYQDGQGGVANFPDKTFSLSDSDFVGAVPFSLNTITGTIINQGQKTQMLVKATTPTTITCTDWNTGSSTNCKTFSLAFNPYASTISCSTWSDSSKKVCTAFKSSKTGETFASISCKTYVSGNSSNHCLTYNTTYSANPWSGSTFFVRVKVCDPNVGLENNCEQYGTSYKPIGTLQENGDKMRFGVFSYFNSDSIDNAVMRSKLKYVAPQQYASSIGTVVNNNAEWLEADGTLLPNPDPNITNTTYTGSVNNSGVINYINKFGSLGSTTSRYKKYDNVGKLYYEALSYIRNRAPDTGYYSGVTSSNSDQFPVITAWDDPQLFSCQKNYIIAMGDTHTHCDKKLPGGTYTSSQNSCSACTNDYGSLNNGDSTDLLNPLNVTTWTNKIGGLEGRSNMATTITGAGCASYYMSGAAFWAKANDIRAADASKAQTLGNQTVKTFVIDVQEYADQGVNSQYWYAAKYGGADSYLSDGTPQGWTNDTVITSSSWPKTLLKAGDPVSMINAVQSAFQSIRAGIGVESALSQSSGDLRTAGGAYIYQAIFNSGGWVGDVLGFSIDSSGNVSSTPTWRASDWFARTVYSPNDRRIFSFNDGLKADGTADTGNIYSRLGIVWPQASLTNLNLFSSRQQALLNKDEVGVTDSRGVARLNYLRGETSNEGRTGYQWRARLGKIGDIVNSSPAYVGAPLPGLIGPGYGLFRQTYANRKPMLYVGSNGGFLHGFDASPPGTQNTTPGQELLAYMPSALFPTLSLLMSANYAHKYYVDGNPVVSEACFGSCPADGSGWKTVLSSGLNAGGQGIFALNVTNPANFATMTGANLVLWEFTDRDDADLGYTFGEPIIRKMNNGKWAVIFGNGYNNTASDSSVSTTGRAYLFIVFVDGPGSSSKPWWRLGTDYVKIELKTTGEPTTLPNNPPNGLSAPVGVDKNLNGTVDLIYAGDRFGNIWKIDVSSDSPSAWAPAFGTTSIPKPLFTAKDSLNNFQQITSSVEVSKHPQGGYLVFFGTGSYIDTTDPLPDNGSTFNKQTFYGIWDKDNFTTVQRASFTPITRSQLQGQTVVAQTAVRSDVYYFQSNCIPNYGTSTANTFQLKADGRTIDYDNCPTDVAQSNANPQLGWRFDLPGAGERMISDRPIVQGGVITFTTLTPALDPCTGNTVGKMYDLDYRTGGRVSRGAAGVYDLNNDKMIDGNDKFPFAVLGSVINNTSTWIAPSGKLLIYGASETPLRLRLPDGSGPTGSGGGGGGSPSISTITTTGGCSDFVAGWGCMSCMGRKPTGGNFIDFVSNQKLGGEGILATGININATAKSIPTLSGRVSWREIMR